MDWRGPLGMGIGIGVGMQSRCSFHDGVLCGVQTFRTDHLLS